MDESKAYLVDPSRGETGKVQSRYTSRLRIPGESAGGTRLGNNRSTNNEYSRNRKHETLQADYFDFLTKQMEPFDEVLLFGPTHAKNELLNRVREGRQCRNVVIRVEKQDKMTKHQRQAYVRKYFEGKGCD